MKNCPWFSLHFVCSNSIESRYRSIRRGNFLVNLVVNSLKSKSKIKSNSEFASLIKLYTRYRSSRSLGLHLIYAFFGYTAKKSGFSEGRGANFVDISRRHSLCIYLLDIKSTLEESLIYYF